MTQSTKRSTAPRPVRPDPALGQIPFRLRIGVTAQRGLDADPALAEATRRELTELIDQLHQNITLIDRLQKKRKSVVELTVISQLASSADRFIVGEIFSFARQHHQRARLEVVLPMHPEAYAKSQNWDDATRAEFEKYLAQASLIVEPRQSGHADGHGDNADQEAATRLVTSCDILLAFWDGMAGGSAETIQTAEILLEAASLRIPCVWIASGPRHPAMNNFDGQSWGFYLDVAERAEMPASRVFPPLAPQDPGKPDKDVLSPLLDSLKLQDRYNGERLPAKFSRRMEEEFHYPDGAESWVAPYFLRATMLARKYQRRFSRSAVALTLLAIVAAAFLGVHLTLNSSSVCDWGEVASLVAITAIFVVLNRGEFHDRWMSYRFLAERMRSARFLIAIGPQFLKPRIPATEYVEQNSSSWSQRAFNEFRQSAFEAKDGSPGEPDLAAVRTRLAQGWIDTQMAYHTDRAAQHQKRQLILRTTILVLFAAAVVCAILDALGVGRSVTGFLSVLCPAAAASLGALLTVRQDRQLAERSRQIRRGLEVVGWQITNAQNRPTLLKAAEQAARIMAEENTSWFDALWFLDVEHPG